LGKKFLNPYYKLSGNDPKGVKLEVNKDKEKKKKKFC
jgi:hypothetical protein